MISYQPLRAYMEKNKISWYDLKKKTGLHNKTIEHLKKDEPVKITSIDYICEKYNILIENVMIYVPNESYVYVPDPVGPKNAKNKNPRNTSKK